MKTEAITISGTGMVNAEFPFALTRKVRKYRCKIHFVDDRHRLNVKSPLAMLTIPFIHGTTVTIEADGPDENEAIQKLVELFAAH